jgi:murein tripeptide amidase MpaA
MPAYLFGLGLNGTDWKTNLLQRPGMLIDGMHHTRELTTLSMSAYAMVKLLYQYVQGDFKTTYLFRNTALFVIPIVNWDGYLHAA